MTSLNGSWIEVFRAGDYGDRGQWTAQDLDRLVAAYDTRLQPAPIVVGHPKTDSPAYGWVARLRRAGQSLWAQLEKVDKDFESLLRDGRFRQRSVALYRHFAPAGGPYLRHIGFLGAHPPAVKGLAPVRFFAGTTEPATLLFTETLSNASHSDSHNELVGQTRFSVPRSQTSSTEVPMPESNLQKLFDHISGFFTEAPLTLTGNDADPTADLSAVASAKVDSSPESREAQVGVSANPPAVTSTEAEASASTAVAGQGFSPANEGGTDAPTTEGFQGKPPSGSPEQLSFADRLTELEQRLDALVDSPVHPILAQSAASVTADPSAVAPPPLSGGLAKAEVTAFVETLRAAGKFPPAFDRLGVTDFLHHLAAQPAPAFACHSEQVSAQPGRVEESYPFGQSTADMAGHNDRTPLAWFQEFLSQLPAVIHFGEMSSLAGDASFASHHAPIRFVEPRRGVEVDPESVALAERAETLAAVEDITYAEALTRLRHEGAAVTSSA